MSNSKSHSYIPVASTLETGKSGNTQFTNLPWVEKLSALDDEKFWKKGIRKDCEEVLDSCKIVPVCAMEQKLLAFLF